MTIWLIKRHKCAFCGELINKLRDQESVQEWHISHMCQECQDKTFQDVQAEKVLTR